MSNRLPPLHMLEEKPPRGRCVAAICFSWKVFTCIVSHVILVLLVVSYCVGGAYLFQYLEKPYETEIKNGIKYMRMNLTDKIWKFSENLSVLSENVWVSTVVKDLASFESQILSAMKTDGWDGDEDTDKTQWTFVGSLFYSIIVITTIGYGHITPRTEWGKVTTIFYAIVGIPLMLLCLSNIGDVMATSFRFLYWRVCCYVCTRTARRPRHRSRQRSVRGHRYSSRSQPPPFRRSMKLTQRSVNDSGVGASIGLTHAYSDPELRTVGRRDYERDFDYGRGGSNRNSGRRTQHAQPPPPPPPSQPQRNGRQYAPPYNDDDQYNEEGRANYAHSINRAARFSSRQRNRDRMRDRHTVERERYLGHSKQHLDSMDDLNMPMQPAKRTLSVRSVRSPNLRRDEATTRTSRDSRELNRLNSQMRGRSVPSSRGRAKSVDPRASGARYDDVDEEVVRKTPIISNKYAIDELEHHQARPHKNALRCQSMPRSAHLRNSYAAYAADPHNAAGGPHHQGLATPNPTPTPSPSHTSHQRNHSFNRQHPRFGDRLELPEFTPSHMNHGKRGRSPQRFDYEDADFDEYYVDEQDFEEAYNDYPAPPARHRERKPRRERSERLPPSPRIMSPMGFAVKRQIRRRPSNDFEDDSLYGDEWSDYYGDISPKDRPVPIWLCVFLVISYILSGAALFAYWEKWSFLDSAYFCFITLTTIGFGDFVPAKSVTNNSEQSIVYCSLYLLFGIALLAMSFNLVQEEFIANVKEVAKRLGILKDDDDED